MDNATKVVIGGAIGAGVLYLLFRALRPASPAQAVPSLPTPASPAGGPPDGLFLQGQGLPAVYQVRNGRLWHVPDPQTLQALGGNAHNILIIPPAALARLVAAPESPPVAPQATVPIGQSIAASSPSPILLIGATPQSLFQPIAGGQSLPIGPGSVGTQAGILAFAHGIGLNIGGAPPAPPAPVAPQLPDPHASGPNMANVGGIVGLAPGLTSLGHSAAAPASSLDLNSPNALRSLGWGSVQPTPAWQGLTDDQIKSALPGFLLAAGYLAATPSQSSQDATGIVMVAPIGTKGPAPWRFPLPPALNSSQYAMILDQNPGELGSLYDWLCGNTGKASTKYSPAFRFRQYLWWRFLSAYGVKAYPSQLSPMWLHNPLDQDEFGPVTHFLDPAKAAIGAQFLAVDMIDWATRDLGRIQAFMQQTKQVQDSSKISIGQIMSIIGVAIGNAASLILTAGAALPAVLVGDAAFAAQFTISSLAQNAAASAAIQGLSDILSPFGQPWQPGLWKTYGNFGPWVVSETANAGPEYTGPVAAECARAYAASPAFDALLAKYNAAIATMNANKKLVPVFDCGTAPVGMNAVQAHTGWYDASTGKWRQYHTYQYPTYSHFDRVTLSGAGLHGVPFTHAAMCPRPS